MLLLLNVAIFIRRYRRIDMPKVCPPGGGVSACSCGEQLDGMMASRVSNWGRRIRTIRTAVNAVTTGTGTGTIGYLPPARDEGRACGPWDEALGTRQETPP